MRIGRTMMVVTMTAGLALAAAAPAQALTLGFKGVVPKFLTKSGQIIKHGHIHPHIKNPFDRSKKGSQVPYVVRDKKGRVIYRSPGHGQRPSL